jgi:hypothetical protein
LSHRRSDRAVIEINDGDTVHIPAAEVPRTARALYAAIDRPLHTSVAQLQQHIDADHDVLVKLGVVAAEFKKIAADAISALQRIDMDTDEDRDLHIRLIASFTAALDAANERQRELTAAVRASNALENGQA